MKYLPDGPIETPGSGGGMIFLFIPGGGRADKGSHSIASPGMEAVGKATVHPGTACKPCCLAGWRKFVP